MGEGKPGRWDALLTEKILASDVCDEEKWGRIEEIQSGDRTFFLTAR